MAALLAPLTRLVDDATRARAVTGKSRRSQIVECVILKAFYGLPRKDYYDYRLFDDAGLTFEDKKRFVGFTRAYRINNRLNDRTWKVFADDKAIFYAVCRALNLPVPTLHAIFDPGRRSYGDVPVLSSATAMAAFLRDRMPYPFFSKPSRGSWGDDTVAVDALDRARDELLLWNGDRIPVPEFVSQLGSPVGGILFQELVRPDADIEARCGRTVSTVRMMLLRTCGELRLFGAIWRIPDPKNWTDNFHKGATGNMLGWVDQDTGRVTRVVAGMGLQQQELERHPSTGQQLLGRTLPDWPAARDVAFTAAAALPGYRFFHFDVALSNRGPVLLEINFEGGLDIYQLVRHQGVFTPELEAACREA